MTGNQPTAGFTLTPRMPAPAPEPVPGTSGPEPAGTVEGHPDGSREPAGNQHREPVPGLAPVPGSGLLVPGTGEGNQPAGTLMVPAGLVPGNRISAAKQLGLAAREHARRAAESQRRQRTFWHWFWKWLYEEHSESVKEHRAYLLKREWLEDYMTGWVRWVIEWENVAYGVIVARTVKVFCKFLIGVTERQSRALAAAAIFAVAFIVWLATHN